MKPDDGPKILMKDKKNWAFPLYFHLLIKRLYSFITKF